MNQLQNKGQDCQRGFMRSSRDGAA